MRAKALAGVRRENSTNTGTTAEKEKDAEISTSATLIENEDNIGKDGGSQ